MSAVTSSRQVNSWLYFKHWFQALPGRAGGAVVMTTVDYTLMRGSEPHHPCCAAELPRSRNLGRLSDDPADSGCEVSPDHDRTPCFARQLHVALLARTSSGWDHPGLPVSLRSLA